VVRVASRAAAGIGVPGILSPGLDEAGLYAIWLAMVTTIAKRSGAELSAPTAAKLVASAIADVTAYSSGSKILYWGMVGVFHAVPFAAVPAAMAMNSALNAALTRRLGRRCIARFSDPRFRACDVLGIVKGLAIGTGGSQLA
jgi:hypothetical protein